MAEISLEELYENGLKSNSKNSKNNDKDIKSIKLKLDLKLDKNKQDFDFKEDETKSPKTPRAPKGPNRSKDQLVRKPETLNIQKETKQDSSPKPKINISNLELDEAKNNKEIQGLFFESGTKDSYFNKWVEIYLKAHKSRTLNYYIEALRNGKFYIDLDKIFLMPLKGTPTNLSAREMLNNKWTI